MLKRILSIILCLSIFVCSVFMCIPFSVKADNIYNTIYDGFDYSSVISQHKTFSFTDKGGKKHTVFKATSSSAWICVFGERQVIGDDDELNYYLSWYSYTGYQSKLNVFFQFLAAQMGIITKGASTILEDAINNSSIYVDYNDTSGLTISSDSVDKLRKQLKYQYYDSIGVAPLSSSGKDVKNALSNLRSSFDYEEDYIDALSRLGDFDYSFSSNYNQYNFCVAFNKSSYSYVYITSDSSCLSFVDSDLRLVELPYLILLNQDFTMGTYHHTFKNIWVSSGRVSLEQFSYTEFYAKLFLDSVNINTGDLTSMNVNYGRFYNSTNSDFLIFKSYEALYNYVKGSQTAYLSSKVEQTGEDIKISIDDMNTNISDKMDELIDSINSKKDGMSADELQKAIDKGLASLSGKMDDIKDNTQETNNKLDSLLTVMQSQNEILMNILGVTTDIYTVVSSKDDEQDKAYDINYVQAVFNTMFKGLKNAVLYGENTVKQDVNQDTDDVNSLVSDVSPDKVNYRNGLFGKFPFSVPYQLFEWLQVLCVEPVAPSFTLSYDFLLKDFIDDENRDNFKLIIDLNNDKYKEWADLMRSGEKLAFTIYMAIATYNRFKNEV